ncbi:hypothetical protein [Streptomyces gibsoniae]|uniref:Uncharacterized protein n=1 Tax=Streptomyces gibsoniae TaxID=3075529 RepID=A0ABU2U8M5_9ACTN|nr:hypothetical protein [Streptomyces sp. DSM 41699]MDT0469435.1 hypothetical protein [Streptomyces sp. DSM 41699]
MSAEPALHIVGTGRSRQPTGAALRGLVVVRLRRVAQWPRRATSSSGTRCSGCSAGSTRCCSTAASR